MKWALLIWCLLLVVVNYYAFLEVFDQIVLTPLDSFAHASGYQFSLKDPINHILGKFLPGMLLVSYIIDLKSKQAITKLKKIYNVIKTTQLLILAILLPILLYIQNKFMISYFTSQKLDTKKNG